MDYDPEIHHRRSVRMPQYDYSDPGAYFITICASRRACTFGEIVNCQVNLSPIGRIVDQCWAEIPSHFENAEIDEFVVMPNHIHGILRIVENAGTACRAPTSRHTPVFGQFARPERGSVATIIRSFKSAATRRARQQGLSKSASIWQRNYYERVVRNEEELARIQKYIIENPLTWELDRENPLSKNFDIDHGEYFNGIYV